MDVGVLGPFRRFRPAAPAACHLPLYICVVRSASYPCRDFPHYLVSDVSIGFVNFFSSGSVRPHSCVPRQALSASRWVSCHLPESHQSQSGSIVVLEYDAMAGNGYWVGCGTVGEENMIVNKVRSEASPAFVALVTLYMW